MAPIARQALNRTEESSGDSLRTDLIGMILAANKIFCEKSFFANKKGFYGLAESGRAHKRDGRYLAAKYTTFLPLNPVPTRGGESRGEILVLVQSTCVRVKAPIQTTTDIHTRNAADVYRLGQNTIANQRDRHFRA